MARVISPWSSGPRHTLLSTTLSQVLPLSRGAACHLPRAGLTGVVGVVVGEGAGGRAHLGVGGLLLGREGSFGR